MKSIQSIHNNAFENCSKLSNITFGNDLTFIGHSCFKNCSLLNNTEESVAASAFSLFPVPAADFLNLVTEEEIIEIEVIDSKGLLKMGLSPARGDRTIQFSVEDLQSGVYLIRIQTEKEIYSRSFIKS